MKNTPILGGARSAHQTRTVAAFLSGLTRVGVPTSGSRMLDVGCGNGVFTIPLGASFREVHGVDIEPKNICAFRESRPGSRYLPALGNSAVLGFPSGYFDSVVTIETLEHVEDLTGTVREISRVLAPGGTLTLTVPNRWYPIEGHGGVLFGRRFSRLPLLPYFPWLHRRIAAARVFRVKDLDRLFTPLGLRREAVVYLWPTFEHGGGKILKLLQGLTQGLAPLMRIAEVSPLRGLGSSVVVRYAKSAPGNFTHEQ